MIRASEIETAGNLVRQIEFWLKECRGAMYGDHTYSGECFEEAKKAAEALSLIGGDSPERRATPCGGWGEVKLTTHDQIVFGTFGQTVNPCN